MDGVLGFSICGVQLPGRKPKSWRSGDGLLFHTEIPISNREEIYAISSDCTGFEAVLTMWTESETTPDSPCMMYS
jgi:hypothetical protein